MTTSLAKKESKQQLNLIQALRGIAALVVVLFHVDQLSNERFKQAFLGDIFRFGWIGVDFFFVLSGFVIFYSQLKAVDRPNWKAFYSFLLKRVVRIYPIYWLVTLLVLAAFLLLPALKNNSSLTPAFIIQSLLLLPQPQVTPILNVGWTLTPIVFFYVIFSLNYLILPRLYLVLVSLILLGSSSQFIENFKISSESPWLWLTFNALHWEFAFGCLAAYWVLNYGIPYRKTLLITGLFFLLLFSFFQTYHLIHEENFVNILGVNFIINRVIFAGIPCFVLIAGAAAIDLKQGYQIAPLLNYFGNASYAIYLIHSPILSACTQIILKLHLEGSSLHVLIFNLLMGVMAIVAGCCFYSWVENPLNRFLRKKIG